MTPEQILIDGLEHVKLALVGGVDLWSMQLTCGEYKGTLYNFVADTLQTYNEAKAKEMASRFPSSMAEQRPHKSLDVGSSPTGTINLLTASPLAEALMELNKGLDTHDDYEYGEEFGYTYIYEGCKARNLRNVKQMIDKTLTQAETLIKHSEAVWAVVEEGKTLINRLKVDCDDDKVINETFSLYAAVEALEGMELK